MAKKRNPHPMMFRSFALIVITLLLTGCSHLQTSRIPIHAFAALENTELTDRTVLPKPPLSIVDYALTFPVFEISTEEVRRAQRERGLRSSASDTYWLHGGDGAQPTVTLRALTAGASLSPVYRLFVGPIRCGGERLDSYVLYRYDFTRTVTGWHRLSYTRHIAKAASRLDLIRDDDNNPRVPRAGVAELGR